MGRQGDGETGRWGDGEMGRRAGAVLARLLTCLKTLKFLNGNIPVRKAGNYLKFSAHGYNKASDFKVAGSVETPGKTIVLKTPGDSLRSLRLCSGQASTGVFILLLTNCPATVHIQHVTGDEL
jgi:hypothetical protein